MKFVVWTLLVMFGFSILESQCSPDLRTKTQVFEDCGSQFKIKRLHVSGCEDLYICIFRRGQRVTITAEFKTSNKAIGDLLSEITMVLNYNYRNLEVDPHECLNMRCIDQLGNDMYSISLSVTIPTAFPTVAGSILMKCKKTTGQLVLCLRAPIKVQ